MRREDTARQQGRIDSLSDSDSPAGVVYRDVGHRTECSMLASNTPNNTVIPEGPDHSRMIF
jgi:hypothetical protein